MQYYKIVEAIQWANGNEGEVIDFISRHSPLSYTVYKHHLLKEIFNHYSSPEVIRHKLVDCIVISNFDRDRIELEEGDFVVYENNVFYKKSQFEFYREYIEVAE